MMAGTGLTFPGMSLENTSQFSPDVGAARVSATHIFRLLDGETLIDADNGGGPVLTLNGSSQMKDVKFEFPTRPDVILIRGMRFKVQPGTTLALVEESDCGKSTVASLIQRFYDVRTGVIDFDRENLMTMNPQELRSHMAFGATNQIFSTVQSKRTLHTDWKRTTVRLSRMMLSSNRPRQRMHTTSI